MVLQKITVPGFVVVDFGTVVDGFGAVVDDVERVSWMSEGCVTPGLVVEVVAAVVVEPAPKMVVVDTPGIVVAPGAVISAVVVAPGASTVVVVATGAVGGHANW